MASPDKPPFWRPGEPVEPLRQCVGRGGMLAIPTESSYGLAVDPTDAVAVQSVFAAKKRPADMPLPVLIAGVEQLADLGLHPDAPEIQRFARYWPAALTVLVPLSQPLPAATGAPELAVRVPEHEALREILAAVGPLTATSANRSGQAPITDPFEAARLLQGLDAMIVDDGELPGGPPSTLVAYRRGEVEVLREGRVSVRELT